MNQRPAPRSLDKWEKAEDNALVWMRHWGYKDARLTPPGQDRGIDVQAGSALAQVKWAGKQVGRDAVQRLFGARGLQHDKALLFFAGPGHGYSKHAIQDADELGVALFQYDIQGVMTPVNGSARSIAQSARGVEPAGAVAVAERRSDLNDDPKVKGAGCILFLALWFTLGFAVVIGMLVDSARTGDLGESGGTIVMVVSTGLLAAFLWLVWLSMRSVGTSTRT